MHQGLAAALPRRRQHGGVYYSFAASCYALMLLLAAARTASAFVTRATTRHAATGFLSVFPRHYTQRLMAASITGGGGGPRVYEEGQDPKELFDLFEPPTPVEIAGAKVEKIWPLGQKKIRSRVHAEGDWHRAVHIWLTDDQGGLLLQKRSEFKDTFPGRWDVSCGGHIESGDKAFPTAVRELEEELGLPEAIAAKVEKLYTLACTNKGRTERHGDFTCSEFQDFFLLRVGEKHEMGLYKYPPGEVTEIKVMHYKDWEAKVAANDPEYVPRAPHYRQTLCAHLDGLFAKK